MCSTSQVFLVANTRDLAKFCKITKSLSIWTTSSSSLNTQREQVSFSKVTKTKALTKFEPLSVVVIVILIGFETPNELPVRSFFLAKISYPCASTQLRLVSTLVVLPNCKNGLAHEKSEFLQWPTVTY